MTHTVICKNVPPAALPMIAEQLRQFGAVVTFDTSSAGRVSSESGRMAFRHDGESLHVDLVEDKGHFPLALWMGGVKQMVEETVERLLHVTNSLAPAGSSTAGLGL